MVQWRHRAPGIVLSQYVPYSRDPHGSGGSGNRRNLEWWQEHHPEWILYQCDRVTPAYLWRDPIIPLDVSNPEVVEWQLNGTDNALSAVNIAAMGYDAIAADNYHLFDNPFGACGVWRRRQWVQLYAPGQTDAYTAANLFWLRAFHAGVKRIATHSGAPLMLVPNFGTFIGPTFPQKTQRDWDYSGFLAVANHSDGILDECGVTGCGLYFDHGRLWESRVRFAHYVQSQGSMYMLHEYWGKMPLHMNQSSIEYMLASYLMANVGHASLFVYPANECPWADPAGSGAAPAGAPCACAETHEGCASGMLNYSQFRANVGTPLGDMEAVRARSSPNASSTPGLEVWLRQMSGALVLVHNMNHMAPEAFVDLPALPRGYAYASLTGEIEHSPLRMQPSSARVLLKQPPRQGTHHALA